MVFIATKEIKEKAKYTKPLGPLHSLRNWKVCHIKPVGFNTNTSIENIDISDIKEHFWRYVNPNNMFILPKEIGDLGEIDIFIEEQKKKYQPIIKEGKDAEENSTLIPPATSSHLDNLD